MLCPTQRFWRAPVAIVPVLLALGGFWPALSAHAIDRGAVDAALASITSMELRRHVDVLADDTFEGREAGSRGGRAAAGYLVKHFEDAGLKPLGDRGSYYQAFGAGYHNLLALLPGSDPELSQEVIVLGAHYDHVGYGNRTNSFGPFGYIHNGADDNASGTACLLELVDAFAKLPEPPKRSILFALWDGEEKGLLGSQHWLAQPTMPLKFVVFAFNVDMVGRLRNDRVEVYGSRTGRGLRRLLGEQNQAERLDLDYTWEMKPNSDHHPFFARSIPVLMLHTGLHDDYHRPSDDAHKIDSDGIQRIARLMFRTSVTIADQPHVTDFRVESRQETPTTRPQFEAVLSPPPPRLGARWVAAEDGSGVVITGFVANSAAQRGGLLVGDRIERCNEVAVTDADKLRLQVLAAPSPLHIVVRRAGRDEPLSLDVPIDGYPVRIGLTWREDDAEPGSVLVNMVIPASAAQQAGVEPRDRVYEVNHQAIRDGQHFRELITTLPGPLELLIERRGKLLTLTLPVVEK